MPSCNQRENKQNFHSAQSLVDTRSVNFIRVFYCAFLVESMHQRKHRQKHKAFASLRLKTITAQARFARPSWTSGFLVLQGLDALDNRFLLPFTFRFAPSCSALRARAPSYYYVVDPPPFRCIFRLARMSFGFAGRSH